MQHHALYIEGSLSLFDAYKAKLRPVSAEQFEKFGIEDARALIERAGLKNEGETIYFIAAGSITSEAQQALLKLFEEPPADTVFVLLVPHGTIIPTLRSRMLPYPRQDDIVPSTNLAVKFLKSSQKERSDFITKLLKDEEDSRETVRELLGGLEQELLKGLKKAKGDKVFLEGLQDIARVRSYVGDRSPSLKMLMEHLALVLPMQK